MFRFLSTLVVTVVALLAGAAWWSGQEAVDPSPETGRTEVGRPAAAPVVEAPPAPARPASRGTTPPRPVRPGPGPMAPVAAEPEPPAAPAPRELPPIPAPRIAERSAPAAGATVEAVYPFDLEVAETLVREPADFDELPDDEAFLEPAPEERTVAMRTDHDASASLIRRLLDVYESLGRRP